MQGKSVLLIDDSIVRGTTMSQIVSMVRNAGAKKVRLGPDQIRSYRYNREIITRLLSKICDASTQKTRSDQIRSQMHSHY